MRAGDLKSSAKRERTPQYVSPVALCQRLNLECREIGIARCEVEPELDWSEALRCVHLKSSRNPAAKRNRTARAPRCIVRSRLSSVYCERLSPVWVRSGHSAQETRCPLYPQKRTLAGTRPMLGTPWPPFFTLRRSMRAAPPAVRRRRAATLRQRPQQA